MNYIVCKKEVSVMEKENRSGEKVWVCWENEKGERVRENVTFQQRLKRTAAVSHEGRRGKSTRGNEQREKLMQVQLP